MISARLAEMAQAAGRTDPVLRVAPTDVAAFLIRGYTIHSLFRLPVKRAFEPLARKCLRDPQLRFELCSWLIIDDKSMLGLHSLYQIDRRLREIYPACADLSFSGLNIILVGDFRQIPPVLIRALYHQGDLNGVKYPGRLSYHHLWESIQLDQVIRQQSNDLAAISFRRALSELRYGFLSHPS